jgi:hypothetical protein
MLELSFKIPRSLLETERGFLPIQDAAHGIFQKISTHGQMGYHEDYIHKMGINPRTWTFFLSVLSVIPNM